MHEPHTILIGNTTLTLIYPNMFVYVGNGTATTWYYGQPKMWDRAITFDYPAMDKENRARWPNVKAKRPAESN